MIVHLINKIKEDNLVYSENIIHNKIYKKLLRTDYNSIDRIFVNYLELHKYSVGMFLQYFTNKNRFVISINLNAWMYRVLIDRTEMLTFFFF